MEPGLSARNPRVVAAARLHRVEERLATGLTLLEGPNLVGDALRAGVVLRELFGLPDDPLATTRGADFLTVSKEALARLSSTRAPQSPVAVIAIPDRPLDPTRSLLVAWAISDPGNLGTMIRTAAAFDLDVGIGPGCTDVWSPKVLRAAAGGHFHTGIALLESIETIEATKVATVVSGGDSPRSMPPGRLALLIGSEARGLPDHLVAAADMRVTIPMPGRNESLNAAAAAAILAYEVSMR